MIRPKLVPVALGMVFAFAATPAMAQTINPIEAPSGLFGATSVDDDALRTITGREDHAQVATADQVAGVSNNSVGDNVRTGDATIADNAFQNLSGLAILNVNTGNNVAINAAMSVNIAIQGPQ